jgi:hypothetical protein
MVTLPPFLVVMTPVVVTFLPAPISFDNTLKHLVVLQGFKVNTSFFASILQKAELHVAAAPVIDRTKKTNMKMPTDLTTVFCIIFPPFTSTSSDREYP